MQPRRSAVIPVAHEGRRLASEIIVSAGSARLVTMKDAPASFAIETRHFLLCLSLTSRPNVRGCFPRCWGRHRSVAVGDLYILPPGEPLRLVGDGALLSQSLVCELREGIVEDHLGLPLDLSDRYLEAALDISNTTLWSISQRLVSELRAPDISSEMLVDHLLSQLAIELARHWKSLARPAAKPPSARPTPPVGTRPRPARRQYSGSSPLFHFKSGA